MTAKTTILVVEDDPVARQLIRGFLASRHLVVEAESCADAERLRDSARPDAAVLDYRLPDGDALELLATLREADPDLPVVILTAHGSIELAVEAMHQGASHFLNKPTDLKALATVLERCLADRRDRRRRRADDSHQKRHRPRPFRGTSDAIARLEEQARRIAASDRPALLTGETGCGKGVLARWLHDHGARAGEPFVALNCAGLKSELLENELFGHAKGAFTGADQAKPGLLEVADRGTLFLDEIGDMDVSIQAKFLKVLEEQTFLRLGEIRERRVDVRLVAATNQKLAAQVRRKRFRSDLYFRLNTLTLPIPPLRQRWEDVPSLVDYYLERLGREVGRPGLGLSPDALEALVRYRWPGNIRELRNVLERAVLLGGGETLEVQDLHFEEGLDSEPTGDTVSFSLAELEERHIRRVLDSEGGSMTRTAKTLGISRSTLYEKVKKYRIDPHRI